MPHILQLQKPQYLIPDDYDWGPFTALQSIILRTFDFKGRSCRKEFWFSITGYLIAFAVIAVGTAIASLMSTKCPWIFNTIYNGLRYFITFLLILPFIAVIARRFHDSGVNNWWIGGFFCLVAAPSIMWLSEDDKFSFESGVRTALLYLVLGIIFIIFMCRRSSAGQSAMRYGDEPHPPADSDEDGNAVTRIIARFFSPKWLIITTSCAMIFCGTIVHFFNKQEWGLSHEIGYRMLALTHSTDGFGPKSNKWFDEEENDFDMSHPLHSAIRKGHTKGVSLLLGAIDVNRQDDHGNTALHIAASEGNEEIVTLLLAEEKIEAHRRNWNGNTPADVATDKCRALIIKAAGAPPRYSYYY